MKTLRAGSARIAGGRALTNRRSYLNAVALFAFFQTRRGSMFVFSGPAGIGAGAVAIYDINRIEEAKLGPLVQVGWGLTLTAVASGSLALSNLIAWSYRKW